ncbi:YdeI/OmpD-associated family protein [Candidatus Saccharibacteria bacterium]|nr:YdeI/OmpD-associated family protein [Candidatus Saccharibacteria bacterium]
MSDLAILPFPSRQAFYNWLLANHRIEPGVRLRIYKVASGQPTITWAEAVEVALCFGWIDSIKNKYDEVSYLQKFGPRRPRSIWSQINCNTVERLIKEGLMQPSGLAQVEAAKADGRWDAAYASPKDMQVPEDFIKLLAEHPRAHAFFDTLNKTNRYAIAFRLQTAKRPETRQRRMEVFLQMLLDGKKFY